MTFLSSIQYPRSWDGLIVSLCFTLALQIDDPFLVDKSITAQHRDIVLALIDEREITLKRLMMTAKMPQNKKSKKCLGMKTMNFPYLAES